jgi:hypothetical protein
MTSCTRIWEVQTALFLKICCKNVVKAGKHQMAASKTTGMLARKQTNKRKTTKIRAKNIANVCGHNRKETSVATARNK